MEEELREPPSSAACDGSGASGVLGSTERRLRPALPQTHVWSCEGVKPQPSPNQLNPPTNPQPPAHPQPRTKHSRPNLVIETRLRQAVAAAAEHDCKGGRSYSQALLLAKARANAANARRSLISSPRRQAKLEEARQQISEKKWFDPGRMRLKDLDPRKMVQQQTEAIKAISQAECLGSMLASVTKHTHVEDAVQRRAHYTATFCTSASAGAASASAMPPPSGSPRSRSRQMRKSRSGGEEGSGSEEEEDGDSGFYLTGASSMPDDRECEPRNHTNFMRQQVYSTKCAALQVSEHSAVRSMLAGCVDSGKCYCQMQHVSFHNAYLGDRGTLALLPLLTFGRRLRFLNLSGNGMRNPSVRQFSVILKDSNVLSTLLVLDLSNNPLGGACGDDLLELLTCRTGISFLGTYGSQLSGERRQRIIRQCLANFASAELRTMSEAMEFVQERERFADSELVLRCGPIEEAARELRTSPRGSPRTSPLPSIRRIRSGSPSVAEALAAAGSSPSSPLTVAAAIAAAAQGSPTSRPARALSPGPPG